MSSGSRHENGADGSSLHATSASSGWQRYFWIAAIVIGLATAGLYVYKSIRAELLPGEGDLIVNVNNATQD